MNVLNDKEYQSLYAFKLMQYGTVYISVISAEKLFSVSYMEKVYSESQDPPNLLNMLGIFLGFNLLLTTLIMVTLIVVSKLLGESIETYLKPDILWFIFYDYVTFVTTLVIVSVILGTLMQRKVYFRYQTEGLRVIQAYKELILVLAAILVVLPYRQLAISVLAKTHNVIIPEAKLQQVDEVNKVPIHTSDGSTQVDSSATVNESNQTMTILTRDSEVQASDGKLAELEKQLEEARTKLSKLETSLAAKEEQLSVRLKEEKEAVKTFQDLNTKEKDGYKAQLDQKDTELLTLKNAIVQLKASITTLEEQAKDCEANAASLKAELNAAKEAKPSPVPVVEVDHARDELIEKIKKLSGDVGDIKSKVESATTHKIIKANYEVLQNKIEELNQAAYSSETSANALLQELYDQAHTLYMNIKEDLGGAARSFVISRGLPVDTPTTVPAAKAVPKTVKQEGGARNDDGKYANEGQIYVNYGSKEYGPYYDFFSKEEGNNTVYKSVQSLLEQVLSGYHVAVFGYGYSGSGKSYALLNTQEGEKGILIQLIKSLTANQNIKKLKVTLDDAFELYSVLAVRNGEIIAPEASAKKSNDPLINIFKNKNATISAINTEITQKQATNPNQTNLDLSALLAFLTNFNIDSPITVDNVNLILKLIERHRRMLGHISGTINNPDSSRSHLFVKFKIQYSLNEFGYLTICDMGGRENPVEILRNEYLGQNKHVLEGTTTLKSVFNLTNVNETNEQKNKRNYIYKLAKQGFYINESINHLMYFFQSQQTNGVQKLEYNSDLFKPFQKKIGLNWEFKTDLLNDENISALNTAIGTHQFIQTQNLDEIDILLSKTKCSPLIVNPEEIMNDKTGKVPDTIGMITALKEIQGDGSKISKFAIFACIREDKKVDAKGNVVKDDSGHDLDFSEFNIKTLEFAQSISSSS